MSEEAARRKVSFAMFGTIISFKVPKVKVMFRRRRKEKEPEW